MKTSPFIRSFGDLKGSIAQTMMNLFAGNIKKDRIMLILGSILAYGSLNWALDFLTLPNAPEIFLRPQIAIPVVMGFAFGPIAGFMTGFFGNAMGDLLNGYPLTYWNWHIANGLIGFIPGLAYYYGIRTVKTAREFGIIQTAMIAGNFFGLIFAFLTELLVLNRATMEDAALNWMFPAMITNILLSLAIVPPLLLILHRMVLTVETKIMLIISYLLIGSVMLTTAVLTFVANSLLLSYVDIQASISDSVFVTSAGLPIQKMTSETTLSLLRWAGLVSVIVLIAGTLSSVFLARRVTAPLVLLSTAARKIGHGDLDYKVQVKTSDEFEELANSFNQMTCDIKVYMNELRRITAEKERMAKELDIARGIQQSFLPDFTPEIEGIDIAAFNLPATEVGGDFYDFIPITKDKWGLVIADVSGKGVPAALFMALSRTIVRAGATGNPEVAEIIENANNLITEDSESGMFVTMFYAVLDMTERSLTYVNAGHNPPLVFNNTTGDLVMLEAEGIPLGVIEDTELEERKIEMKSGDLVIFYTDGVTEAVDDEDRLFGEERLAQIIRDAYKLSARDTIEQINSEVLSFSKNVQQFDDITLIVLKVE
jgi:HAMP domain-containing protein/uncharacterized membrane protein